MNIFNNAAVSYIFDLCCNYPHLRIGVVLDITEYESVFNKCYACMENEIDDHYLIKHNETIPHITFKNGSKLYFIKNIDNAKDIRGNRYNIVFVTEKVWKDYADIWFNTDKNETDIPAIFHAKTKNINLLIYFRDLIYRHNKESD